MTTLNFRRPPSVTTLSCTPTLSYTPQFIQASKTASRPIVLTLHSPSRPNGNDLISEAEPYFSKSCITDMPFGLRSWRGSSRKPGHSEEPERAILDTRNAVSVVDQTDLSGQIGHLDTSAGHAAKLAGFESSETGQFHYYPLPSNDLRMLRVLKILPARDQAAPLVCTLEFAASLPPDKHDDDAVPPILSESVRINYEALSYTWGDKTPLATINLNGCAFKVRNNLEAALRHLRQEGAARTLWVDAVCIDQENLEERGREVVRMSSIYYHARSVIVWLGEGTPESDSAMNFATRIYQRFVEHPVYGHTDDVAINVAAQLWGGPDDDAVVNFRTGINQLCAELRSSGSTDSNSDSEEEDENRFDWMEPESRMTVVKNLIKKKHIPSWVSLHQFFSRHWWGRAWIFQEIAFAKRVVVHCGCISKPWIIISLAAKVTSDTYIAIHRLINNCWRIFRNPYMWPISNCDLISQLIHAREARVQQDYRNRYTRAHRPVRRERAQGSSEWLMANIRRGCELPQDKIFSVLALLPDSLREKITPDYHLPAVTVFKSTVRAYVHAFNWLNIICHSHYAPWYPQDHPSWVPDWTKPPRTTVFVERPHHFHHSVDDIPARASFSGDLSELTVEGIFIGTIAETALEFDLIPGLMKWRASTPSSSRQPAAAVTTVGAVTGGGGAAAGTETQAVQPPDPLIWEFKKAFRTIVAPVFAAHPHFGFTSDLLVIFLQALTTNSSLPSTSKKHSQSRPKRRSIPLSRRAELDYFYKKVRGHLAGRTIFSTSSCPKCSSSSSPLPRYVGIAHEFVETRDLLCLIKGCDAPVVLRQLKGEEWKGREVFMFLGDAHVPGVNKGEAVRGQPAWRDMVIV